MRRKRRVRRVRLTKRRVATGAVVLSSLLGAGISVYIGNDTIPAGCVFPTCFPSASNTGVPAGTSLASYTPADPITTDNLVIDSKKIVGCVHINATGVVIKNSYISCPIPTRGTGDDFGVWCDDGGAGTCGAKTFPAVTIQDTEIDCVGDGVQGPDSQQGEGGHGIAFSNFIARRVNIHGCADGIYADSDALIEDSYIHDLQNDSTPFSGSADGFHADGVQFGDGHGGSATNGALNITLRHNRIEGMGWDPNTNPGGLSFGTSAIISSHQQDHDILIEKNLLMGGANTIYCNATAADDGGSGNFLTGVNVAVKDNHFSTLYSPRVAVASGYLGGVFDGKPTTGCANETGTGNGTGNVIHEGGASYTLDSVP